MTRPHFYVNLDKDSKLVSEMGMRELAEKIEAMNYGVHRLLSHLIDVRREALAVRIKTYRDRGHEDVAQYAERAGDQLANEFERLLKEGLY